jgi:predicted Fe-Mo cluster-binding NifX family protein
VIIAIATERNRVAQHFGRCPNYTLVTVENGKETTREVVSNPGHEPGILPKFLHEKGANCVVAGGMGPRAQDLFGEQSIETFVGISGTIDEVVSTFLKGRLKSGQSACDHGPDRVCEH